jgi:hypothetical protein
VVTQAPFREGKEKHRGLQNAVQPPVGVWQYSGCLEMKRSGPGPPLNSLFFAPCFPAHM